MKITLQSLSKAYGGRDLLKDFSLEIHSENRVAVVGANGTGKSTLLKIMAGESSLDDGRVILPKGTRLGYVAQELDSFDLATPLLTWVLEVLPSWNEFWTEWEKATKAKDLPALERLGARQADLEQVYGYNPEHRAHAILSGLGFAVDEHENALKMFSGGWQERAKLARVLVAGADVLLLDEPTNHLDLEAVEWLEQFLLNYKGVLVLVAHDRIFIEKVATHILFLGGSKPMFRKGSLESFFTWQEELSEQREREAKRLSTELEKKMDFVRRFKAKATKARQAGSKRKQALKIERELEGLVPEPKRKVLTFKWPEPKRAEKTICSCVDLMFGFEKDEPLWPEINFNLFRGQKIALAGPNGCGKSTLLKLVVGDLAPDQGAVDINTSVTLGYFSQHQVEILDLNKSVLGEIRRLADPKTTEEELMSVLGLFMLGQGYFERQVSELSGGEKSRLLLASLFLARANFLVLDEPTNHLDLETREALIQALEEYTGTVLMVAHDRWLLQRAAEQIWALSSEGITVHVDGYDAYEKIRRQEALPDGTGEADGQSASINREDAKRIKRERAELRNAIYRELKPKRAALEKMEQELETILDELSELEATLADPEVYADNTQATELLKQYNSAKDKSEIMLEEMGALEEAIQALEEKQQDL